MTQLDDVTPAVRPAGLRVYFTVKQLLDYVVCILLIIMSLPLMLFISAAIFVCSPGPVLFAQERDGYRGRKIRILKFRTMHLDADARLAAHLAANPEAAQEWARCFKLRRDPRLIGFVGNFLRCSCLDELPQLWNVVRGDMTLVGPRPFPEYHMAAFEPAFRRLRCSVMPGVTGLWQVVRQDNSLEQQVKLDSYYVNNLSFKLDAYVVLKTIQTVVTFRNC